MTSRWAEYRLFWQEFRSAFHSTGAAVPSGRSLARALARFAEAPPAPGTSDERPARKLLEAGPGTGVVTDEILRRLGPHDTLDLVEVNSRFAELLRDRLSHDERWQPYASRVRVHHLSLEDFEFSDGYDAIVSGLPFNNFSPEVVATLLGRLVDMVRAGGTLSYFEYVAIRRVKALAAGAEERRRLDGVARVLRDANNRWRFDRECIVRNVPPAWVNRLRIESKKGF